MFAAVIKMEVRPLLMCFALCVVYATSKPTEKKERVHHDEKLSSKEHNDGENFDYDHDAFLGEEVAKSFDDLTPEESKDRLAWVLLGMIEMLGFVVQRWSEWNTV